MQDVIVFEKFSAEHLAVITINRPEASNAVNTAVMEGLAFALEQARTDDDVRAVILTGQGERSFVAGGDLKEFHAELTSEQIVYAKMSQMRLVLQTIALFPKPVIAAVNGAARGGGGEVASACHFRVGAENATVAYVQAKLGIAPGWGGGVLLERIVGRQQASYLLLTGDVLNAEQALASGYFDAVMPQTGFLDSVKQYARKFTGHSATAVSALLQHVHHRDAERLATEMEKESRLCASLWMTPEHDAAVAAFLNRKK